MKTKPLSRAEQAAERVKGLAREGAWPGALPGVNVLARECGVSPETLRAGLRILEREGVLQNAGAGRPRRIVAGKKRTKAAARALRFGMLARERLEFLDAGYRKVMENVQSEIFGMGHRFFMLPKTQRELGYDFKRIQRMVRAAEADFWLVESGDEELLRWFEGLGQPVFAIGGYFPGFPKMAGAGSLVTPTRTAAIQHLAKLGHRRIVLIQESKISRNSFRKLFYWELEQAGITPGPYNLPEWEETPEGLQTLLESLFQVSPPTAIIAIYPGWMYGVLSFMARRGLKTPDDVSLICGCHDPTFDWLRPQLAYFRHGDEVVKKAMMLWVKRMVQGKRHVKHTKAKVKLVEGETLGPVRKD